jgi:hypothetical protein
MNQRRTFFMKLVPAAGALAVLPRMAFAQVPVLAEDDKLAVSLGFRLHTEKVDQAKFPKHTNEQNCGKCALYSAPEAAQAKCNLFNKIVPKTGWCSGFNKRA